MAHEIELPEVSFITVGTIGPPGERVFHLQAGDGDQLVTLVIEKEQAAALAHAVDQLMEELSEKLDLQPPKPDLAALDMALHEPILPAFRVGRLGIAFDEDSGTVAIVAQELQLEDDLEEPSVARFYATREQMVALSEHAQEVVSAGRPICAFCGEPEDPQGHFCPKRNGHGEHVYLS